MLTRLIQRTETVSEGSIEYEYRDADYEYESYKKSSGKQWYFSEIIELERLKDLPEGLKRR